MFQDRIAVVTGGTSSIGKYTYEEFEKRDTKVCVTDIRDNPYFVGDIGDEQTLRHLADMVIKQYGHVDYPINNAPPLVKGINNCSYGEFNDAFRMGVTAPFMLTQLFLKHFAPRAGTVNISSGRDRMSQPFTESYSAARGGTSALTHALAVSLAGKVRVNPISPGWIDTKNNHYRGVDANQHPADRVETPLDIADMVLYLCSEQSGFITGENICIDGGMTHQMIYHGDFGWHLETMDEF